MNNKKALAAFSRFLKEGVDYTKVYAPWNITKHYDAAMDAASFIEAVCLVEQALCEVGSAYLGLPEDKKTFYMLKHYIPIWHADLLINNTEQTTLSAFSELRNRLAHKAVRKQVSLKKTDADPLLSPAFKLLPELVNRCYARQYQERRGSPYLDLVIIAYWQYRNKLRVKSGNFQNISRRIHEHIPITTRRRYSHRRIPLQQNA